MTKSVVCFGEALIDFLNTGVQQDEKLALNQFTQFPGGAPANVAVAVAKLGGKVKFAGQVGNDPFGLFLKEALQSYGVDTRFTDIHPTAKTALAFVFLDENGERSFAFHREATADLLFQQHQVHDNWFAPQDIFHFCSNTLTEQNIADVTRYAVSLAKQQQCIVSFDVNLRHNLWAEKCADRAVVNQLVMQSQVVKFSKDELEYLSDNEPEEYLQQCLSNGVRVAIVTDGGGPITLINQHHQVQISPPPVTVADTTGGGDAFIGAVLFGLCQEPQYDFDDIASLTQLIRFASHCGALAVSRPGAFPAFPTFQEVQDFYHAV